MSESPTDLKFILGVLAYVARPDSKDLAYIFGGFVRDLVRGVAPVDVDIKIPDEKFGKRFVDFLIAADRLRSILPCGRRPSGGYHTTALTIQTSRTDSLAIDLVESIPDDCGDFTCNNLRIDRLGSIHARLPGGRPDWTVRCIRDAVIGSLVWMVPPGQYDARFKFRMWRRLRKMLAKGYCVNSEAPSVYGYVPAEMIPLPAGGVCCVDGKAVGSDGGAMRCGHLFHEECLTKWIDAGHHDCPVCIGTPIEFTRA